MKTSLLLFLLMCVFMLFPSFACAGMIDGISGFFSSLLGYVESFWAFLTVGIPTIIGDFFVWLSSYLLYLKFTFLLSGLEFAHSVSTTFLEMINISDAINVAIDALPQDFKQIAIDIRFFDALTLVIEAWITKMVYSGF